ncbi:MAG: DUF4360 domain-containing protein [Cyanobacteria bacterium J06635_10]
MNSQNLRTISINLVKTFLATATVMAAFVVSACAPKVTVKEDIPNDAPKVTIEEVASNDAPKVTIQDVASKDAPKVKITRVSYGGSGCPDGTANVQVSPDGQELSILFKKFIANAGGTPKDSRKNCNLAIPIKVPTGFQVSFNGDYRGYVAPATVGRLSAEHFFAGERGPRIQRTIKGEQDYIITENVKTPVWSACGDDVNIRVNTSIRASGEGIAKVDSAKYKLRYRAC